MRSGDHIGGAKHRKRHPAASFLTNYDRHKRFPQNELRRAYLQNCASEHATLPHDSRSVWCMKATKSTHLRKKFSFGNSVPENLMIMNLLGWSIRHSWKACEVSAEELCAIKNVTKNVMEGRRRSCGSRRHVTLLCLLARYVQTWVKFQPLPISSTCIRSVWDMLTFGGVLTSVRISRIKIPSQVISLAVCRYTSSVKSFQTQ